MLVVESDYIPLFVARQSVPDEMGDCDVGPALKPGLGVISNHIDKPDRYVYRIAQDASGYQAGGRGKRTAELVIDLELKTR